MDTNLCPRGHAPRNICRQQSQHLFMTRTSAINPLIITITKFSNRIGSQLPLIGQYASCLSNWTVRAITLVIKQIGLLLRGRPILLITCMITDRIGLHSVLLPLLIVPFDQYNGPILYFKKYIKAVGASSSCEK